MSGRAWASLARCGPVRSVLVESGEVRFPFYGKAWFGVVRCASVWLDRVMRGQVRYGSLFSGMVGQTGARWGAVM